MFKGIKRKIEAVLMFDMIDLRIPVFRCRTMFQTEKGVVQTELQFCMN